MTENELRLYIESNLESNYEKITSAKESGHNQVIFFKHKENGKMLVERISTNRNDDVFRLLKGKIVPNLEKIYDVCSDEEALVVLEEFIEGESLLEILDKGTLPVSTACRYACDICDALITLHGLGIVHRDIKPSNIIINSENHAVLIDLSIARIISSTDERDTHSLGTIGYAAPEQFGLSQSEAATDIYALGVLLNIMITGVHPTIDTPKGFIGHVIDKATSTQISKRWKSAAPIKRRLKIYASR